MSDSGADREEHRRAVLRALRDAAEDARLDDAVSPDENNLNFRGEATNAGYLSSRIVARQQRWRRRRSERAAEQAERERKRRQRDES